MRVCLLNESFPPVIDGVVNVVMNYANYMTTDFGAEVMVGTPEYPGADYTQYPYKVVPYHSFDTGDKTSGYRAGNPFDWKELGELSAFQPEIIHSHCPASATVVGRLLREQCDAPLVFTYHTKYDVDIARWVKVKSIAQEGVKAMVGNIEACDEVWTVSRGAGESLKALGFQGDYRVMNNGVDFARGRVDAKTVAEVTAGYDLPDGVPMYLYVGRLMTYKGLPIILDALKLVADAGQDFRMVFVGKGPDREMLETKAKELGIDGKCIFVGAVYDRDILRAWNTRADLFLFPSTFDTNGLVVREAAACGLASVLIEGSCAAEGITNGRNGFTIEENAQSMAQLLLRVSGDLSHLHDVGTHAMEEIYLSWKDCVAQAYDRYQVILENKKSGLLLPRKHLPTDTLVKLTARGMYEMQHYDLLRKELFGDFKDTAAGMSENNMDSENSTDHLTERLKGSFEEWKEDMKENLQKIEQRAGDMMKDMSDVYSEENMTHK